MAGSILEQLANYIIDNKQHSIEQSIVLGEGESGAKNEPVNTVREAEVPCLLIIPADQEMDIAIVKRLKRVFVPAVFFVLSSF